MMYGCSMDQRLRLPPPEEAPVVPVGLSLKAFPHHGEPAGADVRPLLTGTVFDLDRALELGRWPLEKRTTPISQVHILPDMAPFGARPGGPAPRPFPFRARMPAVRA